MVRLGSVRSEGSDWYTLVYIPGFRDWHCDSSVTGIMANGTHLGHKTHVNQADILSDLAVFRPPNVEKRLPTETIRLPKQLSIAVIHCALPTGDVAHYRAPLQHSLVQGRELHAPRRLVALIGIMAVISLPERLLGAVLAEGLRGVEVPEPGEVDAGDVGGGLAVGDPLGDEATDSAPGQDADGVETSRNKVAGDNVALADAGTVVGGEAVVCCWVSSFR